MTRAELVVGDNNLGTTRLEELHALLDEFHEEQRAAKRAVVAVMA